MKTEPEKQPEPEKKHVYYIFPNSAAADIHKWSHIKTKEDWEKLSRQQKRAYSRDLEKVRNHLAKRGKTQ